MALKLKAAGQVLDYLLKIREVHNFEQRMLSIEQAVALARAEATAWANAQIEDGAIRIVDYREPLRNAPHGN